MAPPTFSLRALADDDAPAYNAFLLRGVEQHPDTLRISPADITAQPFKTPHGADSTTFAAVAAGGSWLGVVTVEREQGRSKRRHVAWVLRMYVDARASGSGIGRALLRRAIARAQGFEGVAKLNLTVAAHNQRAVGLYESEGFVRFALEDDAFRDPTPRSELTLSKRL
jgi:ribosomal protein S18 acetylase RimI-like enzyme